MIEKLLNNALETSSMVFASSVLILSIGFVVAMNRPKTKTCYVTEWSERQRDGQKWREPKTTICVEGEK